MRGNGKENIGRTRGQEIHLRLGQEEMELLKKKAASYNMTRSDYLRNLCRVRKRKGAVKTI